MPPYPSSYKKTCNKTEHDLEIVNVEELQVASDINAKGEFNDKEIRVIAFCKKCGMMTQSSIISTKKLMIGK